METIDRRLHSSFAKKKIFGLDAKSVEYPDKLYARIIEELGMDIIVIGSVKNDDCSLAWYRDRKYVQCTGFVNSRLPVGRATVVIFHNIYMDKTKGLVTETGIWANSVDNIGGICKATVKGVKPPEKWNKKVPKLFVKIKTKPGELAMFSTSASDFEIKYGDVSITGESWQKSGGTFLFRDGEYVEIGKGYITGLSGAFVSIGSTSVPVDSIMKEIAKDKGIKAEEAMNGWSIYAIEDTADVSEKISEILGIRPTVLASGKLEWGITVDDDWKIHVK